MKILQIHDSDLIGRNFNGFDLQLQLNQRGIECKQMVKKKYSNDKNVIQMPGRSHVEQQLMNLEQILSLNNVFPPYGRVIEESKEFQEADIVHIHMVHHYLISYLDIPRLMGKKKCIWTIHDPWIFTGHCVHPIECMRWKTGCKHCEKLDRTFQLDRDHASYMWNMKQLTFCGTDLDIVVATEFMRGYVSESPITKRLLTRTHVIPFGVEEPPFCQSDKQRFKEEMQIDKQVSIIGFRLDDDAIKGCEYLWKMLRYIDRNLQIVAIGRGNIPADIMKKYNVINFGWSNNKEEIMKFHTVCDIFLMPSLAESFGVMAIEAMAAESTVVCFKGTVVEEITRAPDCGVAVAYADSEAMGEAVCRLLDHTEEVKHRGCLGRKIVEQYYTMDHYVNQHIKLYHEIMKR